MERAPGARLGYVPQVEQIDWDFPVTVAQCVLMSRVRGRVLPWASRAEKADVARVLDRLLRVHTVVQQVDQYLRVALGLHRCAHHPEDGPQGSIAGSEAGD